MSAWRHLKDPKDQLAIFLSYLLACLAWSLWQFELNFLVGWGGTHWLHVPFYTTPIICGIAAISYMLPLFIWGRNIPLYKYWTIFFLLMGSSWGAYSLAYLAFANLYSKIHFGDTGFLVGSALFVLVFLESIVFWATRTFFGRSPSFHILSLAFMFIMCVPLSLISIDFFPAFGGGHNFIDAVKMGYPIFWVCLQLGILSYAIHRRMV
ncbi:hypothetical protein PPO43_05170 [Saprospira sp. CCB-QB6]|uniref:hypothetical protein n=1 Tax=Saprospira sp. CCB-QB6 TaxID=3023936 RepID=UPI00234B2939|nr:hypothetical protein [Saprospira sp. CCB-QB6]WCL82489.1 hypothetical protein PPO43_05170 [Saprospira sp. CCB-QB6]